jgi:phosphoglycolate phosphatase
MFARIWPALDPAKIRLLTAEFRAHYDDSGCLLSKPYPGVLPTLANLHEAGWRLFVLTNKPSAPTGRILKSLGLLPYLEAAYSPDSLSPPTTSKPEGARLMMRRHGLDPLFTTLVGDGKDDKASAATCGWRFIAAGYGYGGVSAPQRVEKFSDIADLLL